MSISLKKYLFWFHNNNFILKNNFLMELRVLHFHCLIKKSNNSDFSNFFLKKIQNPHKINRYLLKSKTNILSVKLFHSKLKTSLSQNSTICQSRLERAIKKQTRTDKSTVRNKLNNIKPRLSLLLIHRRRTI